MDKILSIEQAREKAVDCSSYTNGDYEYTTNDGYCHLIRDGVDLLEGKKAVYCWSYSNGDYQYKTKNGYWHLIRDGVDVLTSNYRWRGRIGR